jgi:thiamine pyrophosphate-dependent acetolactate synthase large subunit-like protein
MKVAQAIARAMKAEGIDMLFAYPVNPLIEAAAAEDIRTIIVRQERTGLHMADAVSRVPCGGVAAAAAAGRARTRARVRNRRRSMADTSGNRGRG